MQLTWCVGDLLYFPISRRQSDIKARGLMAGRRRRNVMNIDEVADRPMGDAQLVEDLRLQIQHLQHRLRIYEEEQATEDRDVDDHDEKENPFHQDDSNDATPLYPQ